MRDIMEDYKETLLELILNALEKGDSDLLNGIQTLDSALEYTGVMGMASVIDSLITASKEFLERAKKIRKMLETRSEYFTSIGEYEKLKETMERLEEGFIPVEYLFRACKNLKNVRTHVQILFELGLIEIKDIRDRKYIRFSKKIRDNLPYLNGNAFGKILSVAVYKTGFTSLIPLIHAYLRAEKKGEIKFNEFLYECVDGRVHKPARWAANLIERDKKKIDAIRAFEEDGERLIVNPAAIYMIKEWRKLALERARKRGLGI